MDLQIRLSDQFNKVKNYCCSLDITNSILFEISEFDSITLSITTNHEVEKIEVETPEGYKFFKPNENILISNFNNGLLYVPGTYQLKIVTLNKSFKAFFKVLPNNMSEFQLLDMKSILEDFSAGITSDILIRRELTLRGNQKNGSVFEIADYVHENQDYIIYILENIARNPHLQLEKKYKYSKFQRKINSIAVRKLTQGNSDSTRVKPYFEAKMEHSYDTNVNKWLKSIIREIQSDLSAQLKVVDSLTTDLNSVISSFSNKKQALYDNYQRIKSKLEVSEEYKTKILKTIRYTEYKINEAQQTKRQVNLINEKIRPTIEYLNNYAERCFLSDVDFESSKIRMDKYIFKDYKYSSINSYYEKIRCNKSLTGSFTKGYSEKQTYLLFEYYCVIFLIKLLVSEGYEWKEGWLIDANCLHYDLPSGTKLKFSNGNKEIILQYDCEIYYQVDLDISDFVAINSQNRKPDILLSTFENGTLKGAMIFEVKYRNSKYIYNEYGDTKVIEQMKNYLQLAYYDCSFEDTLLDPIKKVVILYPTQKTKINYQEKLFAKKFHFVDIEPRVDFENHSSFENLSVLLNELLNNNFA